MHAGDDRGPLLFAVVRGGLLGVAAVRAGRGRRAAGGVRGPRHRAQRGRVPAAAVAGSPAAVGRVARRGDACPAAAAMRVAACSCHAGRRAALQPVRRSLRPLARGRCQLTFANQPQLCLHGSANDPGLLFHS